MYVIHVGGDFTLGGSVRKKYAPELVLEPIHNEVNLISFCAQFEPVFLVQVHLDFDIPNERCVGKAITTIRDNASNASSIVFEGVNFLDVHVADADGKALESS